MSTNVIEQKQTDKRYLVTVRYYLHAGDDETAKRESFKLTKQLNKADDCQASVDELQPAPIGKPCGKSIL